MRITAATPPPPTGRRSTTTWGSAIRRSALLEQLADDLVLLNLARGGRRQRREELQALRQLVGGQAGGLEPVDHRLEVQRHAVAQYHARAHALAQPFVGK